jgi:hypothetical protein
LQSGGLAAAATTVAAIAAAKAEGQPATAGVNPISHILWGDEAAAHDEVDFKHTGAGLGLNAAAVISWGVVFEAIFGGAIADSKDWPTSLAGGATVAALAYLIDYYVVPKRFTPGFELRLSNQSLFGIYSALALGLGLGGLVR